MLSGSNPELVFHHQVRKMKLRHASQSWLNSSRLHSLTTLLLGWWWLVASTHFQLWTTTAVPDLADRVSFERLSFDMVWDAGTIRQQAMSEHVWGGNKRREYHRRALGIAELRNQEEYPALYRDTDIRAWHEYRAWVRTGMNFDKMPRWMAGISSGTLFWTFFYGQLYEAQAQPTGAIAQSCPHFPGGFTNSTGQSDGCTGAPVGMPNNRTLVQHPDFFSSYAPQSGQRYTTRPPWNVAGVDYPVGIPAGTIFSDPAVTCPTGAGISCSYQATGNLLGGPYLQITSTGNPLTINGFDFSGNLVGSHGCVAYASNAPYSSNMTVRNSYFAVNSACFGKSNPAYGNLMFGMGNPTIANLFNNTFDFSPVWTGPGFKAVGVGTPMQQMNVKYNVFHNIPENPFNGNPTNFGLLFEYNLFDNWTFSGAPNQNHGELTDFNGGGTRSTYYWFFNTMLQHGTSGKGAGTAQIWFSAATDNGSTFGDSQARNNTQVANCNAASVSEGAPCPGSASAIDSALWVIQDNNFTNLAITDNYFDNIGSLYVGLANGATCSNPVTWSGNVQLTSGSTISKASGLSMAGGSKGC